MSVEIVKPDEIEELTGSKTTRKQSEVLSRHGIKFIVRTDGKIRTTWTAINSALAHTAKAQSTEEPDLDFLKHG